jgi:ATP-binding cassette, subfamily C (CFTR/MRP), member 1
VVGRTGSGKSTTILSLLRLLQTHEGTIKIDGTDIYALDLQTLRSGFSVILQDHFLFSGTVRENIDPRREFKDEEIIQALESCGLWENIRTRSGLDTVIEEGGGNFSAGEKQLMNISRTLLNPRPIVLVDEATASIDLKSDDMLQKVLKEQLQHSTIITIAHRIDTIISSDRILVLDKGRIVELDSPQNLLKRTSTFGELYKEYQNK